MGAVSKWPNLRGIVLDHADVCAVASQFIESNGLQTRVSTYAADFFNDPYPYADLHLYSQIFHDWPPDRCRFLTMKSWRSLPRGGRIVIHEMLFDDDRSGPFAAAAFNIDMMVTMLGQQYSGAELRSILFDAGFSNIDIRVTLGHWSIVTAIKENS